MVPGEDNPDIEMEKDVEAQAPTHGRNTFLCFTHGYKLRLLIRDALTLPNVTVEILAVGTPKSTLSEGKPSEHLYRVDTPGQQCVCNNLENTFIVRLNSNDTLDLSKAAIKQKIDNLLYVVIGNGAVVKFTTDTLEFVCIRHGPSKANVEQEASGVLGAIRKVSATQATKMNPEYRLQLDAITTDSSILDSFLHYIRRVLDTNHTLHGFMRTCF
jgi:broad specificity phosphatase PhoE